MSFRDTILPTLYAARALPGTMGLRPYIVAIVSGQWNGSNTGRGAAAFDVVPVTESGGQPPKVRQLNSEELALTGFGKGSWTIGPVTPDFPGGGTPLSTLKPAVDAGQTVLVQLTGPEFPNGAQFQLKSFSSDRALHWTMVVSPVEENP